MLSACLYLWDIMWKREFPAFKEDWRIKAACHVIHRMLGDVRVCNCTCITAFVCIRPTYTAEFVVTAHS